MGPPGFQLEVFHWMTECATRPYYDFRGTAMEGRLLEAVLINALAGAGLAFGEPFLRLHGNLLYPVEVGEESIPDGCSLAKRRYLARCVRLFGSRLATAGIHTNHSYPSRCCRGISSTSRGTAARAGPSWTSAMRR